MKKNSFPFHLALISLLVNGCTEKPRQELELQLTVYSYDSFAQDAGPGTYLRDNWAKGPQGKSCGLKLISVGDGVELVNRLKFDQKSNKLGKKAQVVVGLDQNTWPLVAGMVDSRNIDLGGNIAPEYFLGPGFIPFNYGHMTFMANTELLKKLNLPVPKSLKDLLTPQWKRHFVIQDPLTSTPGLGFLAFTQAVLPKSGKDSWEEYWRQLKEQWLIMASGWSMAYGLFTAGETPLVWSYATSEAYHLQELAEKKDPRPNKYTAIFLEEGVAWQVEGAAMVKGIDDVRLQECATYFLQQLASVKMQEQIPLKNWMYPVLPGIKLPEVYGKIPTPPKVIRTQFAPQLMDQYRKVFH